MSNVISFRVSGQHSEWLYAQAEARGLTAADILRELIEDRMRGDWPRHGSGSVTTIGSSHYLIWNEIENGWQDGNTLTVTQ